MIIFGWILVSIIIGLLATFVVKPLSFLVGGTGSQISFLFFIVCAILIGAVMWISMLRFKKEYVDTVFNVGIAMMFSGIARDMLPENLPMVLVVVFAMVVALITYILYQLLINRLRGTWKGIQPFVQYNNGIMVVAIAFIAAGVGKSLVPWVAILLFFIVAIYDAIAVWKTEHMQEMALGFIELGIIPGIAVAKRKKGQFALLGGGDIFFLVLIMASLIHAPALATLTVVGMFGALVYLFYASTKDKFYPALPFMFGGMIVGIIGHFMLLLIM